MSLITRYQIPRDGLHADSTFSDAVIAKYTASEGLALPSAGFTYPKLSSAVGETVDRLSTQLITLNRIRVQMTFYNQHWLQQYAFSLSNSCRLLLQQLNIRGNTSMGTASQTSVRELEQIFRELQTSIAEKRTGDLSRVQGMQAQSTAVRDANASSVAAKNEAVAGQPVSGREQEEVVLRILTAASRGNGTRERYMSQLHRRLYESGRGNWKSRLEILDRAGTELLLLKETGSTSTATINGWTSEMARRFFRQVQYAPRHERELLLQAGGYGTIVSLERALRSMDSAEFRSFSIELMERMQQVSELSGLADTMQGEDRFGNMDEQLTQISPEVWTTLTELLEKEGYFFTEDGIVSLDEENIPQLASEQARQLFWRIQRAPEQERQFFLEAGGFSSMEALGKVLKTMDDVTFRKFSAQILERLHAFAANPGQAAAAKAEKLIRGGDIQHLDASLIQNPDVDNRIQTQKQIFRRRLEAGGEGARVLEKVLRTVTQQRQLLTENTQIFDALSESVLNMTMDDWHNFRTEITNINKPDLPENVDFSFLQISSTAGTEASAQKGAAGPTPKNGESPAAKSKEELRIEEGIRMSREKRELIRELQVLSRIPDGSIRTVERLLREHTVLRGSDPTEEGTHFYQGLTARERENWHSFITDLLSVPGGSGSASIPSEQVFYRIHTGSAGDLLTMLRGNGSGRDTALNALEKLREERILTEELPAQKQSDESMRTDTHFRLRQGTAALDRRNTAGSDAASAELTVAAKGAQDLELMPAEMEVPRRGESAQQEAKAPGRQKVEERSESSYQDIEFETTSYHTEEKSVREAADLGEIMERLDRQQRAIERLQSTQQKLAQHNVPRDVLKKLDARAQMERLRGGR